MNFIDTILDFFRGAFDNVIDAFEKIIDFLAVPLMYLLEFLAGIFYFVVKVFDVIVHIVMIFVACFQFLFSVIAGVFRTIFYWTNVTPTSDVVFPDASSSGFATVMDILQPTGMLTVVPLVATAFVWFYFIYKIIALFGGQIIVKAGGS